MISHNNFEVSSSERPRNSSVIRQKGKSQNGCFKKTKHVKFSEKTNISNPLIRTVRNVHFFGKLGVLCFLEIPVSRFVLLPYYQGIKEMSYDTFKDFLYFSLVLFEKFDKQG